MVKIKSSILSITLFFNVLFSVNAGYVKFTCKDGKRTIEYPSGLTAPEVNCSVPVFSSSLTDKQKENILKLHNQYRNRAAKGRETHLPPAKSMPMLEWDSELEKTAMKWADQCKNYNDVCKDGDQYPVGQNLAINTGIGQDLFLGDYDQDYTKDLITYWYHENGRLSKEEFSSWNITGDALAIDYTQMVWGKTTKIGCGQIVYAGIYYPEVTFLVCNYDPAGNVPGEPVYEVV